MKNNLSKSLMTSRQAAFSALLLSVLLTSFLCLATPARADDVSEIRDHINRGNVLLSRRLFQDAINEYEAVLQIEPNNPIAKNNIALTHNNWGIYLYALHKFAEAKEHWTTSLKLNPSDGKVRRNLQILESQHPPEKAPPAADAAPKATGPQDWNPFNESLDKVPPKKDAQSSAAPVATPTAPNTVAVPGQQQATIEPPPAAQQSPENTSGAVLILGTGSNFHTNTSTISNPAGATTGNATSAGTTYGSATSSSAGYNVTPEPPPSVRIVGGTSGGASIVGGSTVSGGGRSFAQPTTSSTSPVVTAPITPVRIPAKPAGGSVPMSWPGGDESQPAITGNRPATKPVSKTPPSFLARPDDKPPQESASSGSESSTPVEDQLSQIENKVYGKVSKNMPILKRIEKLEVETMGKKSSGSVSDRLKELKDTYGL